MIWAALLLLVAAAAAAPFVIERRKPDMDGPIRDEAPGRFAALGDGLTHFRWYGPDDGPPVVCIHGLTTPSVVWHRLARGLAGHGFRVLTYDLYGRGFSDRPRGAQTRAFFTRQLRELLQDQGLDDGLTLVGYSMGGSLAAIFAAEEPRRLRRLVLIAPAGLRHAPGALAEAVRRLPGPGDWLMLAFGARQLRRGIQRQPGHPSDLAELARVLVAETRLRGYLPAVLSSQRNLLAEDLADEHRVIAAEGIPVLAIWGAQDAVIPPTAMGRLAELNGAARQVSVNGAGHGLVYTHSHEALAAIEDALVESAG